MDGGKGNAVVGVKHKLDVPSFVTPVTGGGIAAPVVIYIAQSPLVDQFGPITSGRERPAPQSRTIKCQRHTPLLRGT